MAQAATDMDVVAMEQASDEASKQQLPAETQDVANSTPPRARPGNSRPPKDAAPRSSPGRAKDPPVEYLYGCSKCRFLKAGCSRCVRKPLAGRPRSRWMPAEALPQEGVPSAPIFRPTAEEFADPYTYIAQIREQAAAAGIAMVVPPVGWQPPSMLRDPVTGQLRDDLKFPVRRQPTHLLCRRYATADGGPEEEPKRSASPAAAAAATVAHDGVGPLPVVSAAANGAAEAAGVTGAAAAAGMTGPAGTSAAAEAMDMDAAGVAEPAANGADVAMADADVAAAAGRVGSSEDGASPTAGLRAASAATDAAAAAAVAADAPSTSGGGGATADAAAAVGSDAAARDQDAEASSSSDDEDAAFGYDHLDQKLSLRSFQRYAAWAKRQHFSEPFCPTATQPPPRLAPKPAAKNGTARSGKAAPRRVVIEQPEGGPDWGVVEAEFWRIVEAGDAQVESLYGQDVDTATYGSGFPTSADLDAYVAKRAAAAAAAKAEAAAIAAEAAALADSSDDERGSAGDAGAPNPGKEGKEEQQEEDELEAGLRRYCADPWNLNNLPHGSGSVLKYVREDIDGKPITGIMVPWLYVGSMFSAFCWHIEDHGLYSINYLHEGAPKIWYGVPAHAAKKLEAAMRDALPHLFEADPGLLHRLVTMLSPKQLMARGVPVCRAVHAPGTFVITFPDAYHGGFNSGYNVAEAVNFACPDWLPFGTDSIARYRSQHRPMTFSHDALLVHLAEDGVAAQQQEQQCKQQGQEQNEKGATAGAQKQEEQGNAAAGTSDALQQEAKAQQQQGDGAVEPKAEQQQQQQEQQHQQGQQQGQQQNGHDAATADSSAAGVADVKVEQQEQQQADAAVVAVKAEQKQEEEQQQQQQQEQQETLLEFEQPGWETQFVQQTPSTSKQKGQQTQQQQQEWRPQGGEQAEPLWDLPATAAQLAAAAAAAGPASVHHAPSMRASTAAGSSMRSAPTGMRTVAAPNAAKPFVPGVSAATAAAAAATAGGHHHGHHHGHGHKSQRERKYTMRGSSSSNAAAKARPPPPPPSRALTVLAVGELAVRLAEERRMQALAALEHGVGAVRTMLGDRMALDNATGVHLNTQGVECRVCSADLYMSAVVSSRAPGQAVCPEHTQQLGPSRPERLLLIRYAPGTIGQLLQRAVAVLGNEGRDVVAVARRRAAAAAVAHAAEMVGLEAERMKRAAERENTAAEAATAIEGVQRDAGAAEAAAADATVADATEKEKVAGAVAAAIRSLGALYDPAQLSRQLFAELDESSDDETEALQPNDDSDDDDKQVYVPGVLYSYSSPKPGRTKSGGATAATSPTAAAATAVDAKRGQAKRKRSIGPKAGVAAHAEAEKARSAVDPAAEQAFLEREQEFLASQGVRKRKGAIAAQHHMRALLEYLT